MSQPSQKNKQPQTFTFGKLLKITVNKSYQDLKKLQTILPNKSDLEKKDLLCSFFEQSRFLFLKLLVLQKWKKNMSSTVSGTLEIFNTVNQDFRSLQRSADSLWYFHNKVLSTKSTSSIDIRSAVEILKSGSLTTGMPLSIENALPVSLSQDKIEKGIEKLNKLIKICLLDMGLPKEFNQKKVFRGFLWCKVGHEFVIKLTIQKNNQTYDEKQELKQCEINTDNNNTGNNINNNDTETFNPKNSNLNTQLKDDSLIRKRKENLFLESNQNIKKKRRILKIKKKKDLYCWEIVLIKFLIHEDLTLEEIIKQDSEKKVKKSTANEIQLCKYLQIEINKIQLKENSIINKIITKNNSLQKKLHKANFKIKNKDEKIQTNMNMNNSMEIEMDIENEKELIENKMETEIKKEKENEIKSNQEEKIGNENNTVENQKNTKKQQHKEKNIFNVLYKFCHKICNEIRLGIIRRQAKEFSETLLGSMIRTEDNKGNCLKVYYWENINSTSFQNEKNIISYEIDEKGDLDLEHRPFLGIKINLVPIENCFETNLINSIIANSLNKLISLSKLLKEDQKLFPNEDDIVLVPNTSNLKVPFLKVTFLSKSILIKISVDFNTGLFTLNAPNLLVKTINDLLNLLNYNKEKILEGFNNILFQSVISEFEHAASQCGLVPFVNLPLYVLTKRSSATGFNVIPFFNKNHKVRGIEEKIKYYLFLQFNETCDYVIFLYLNKKLVPTFKLLGTELDRSVFRLYIKKIRLLEVWDPITSSKEISAKLRSLTNKTWYSIRQFFLTKQLKELGSSFSIDGNSIIIDGQEAIELFNLKDLNVDIKKISIDLIGKESWEVKIWLEELWLKRILLMNYPNVFEIQQSNLSKYGIIVFRYPKLYSDCLFNFKQKLCSAFRLSYVFVQFLKRAPDLELFVGIDSEHNIIIDRQKLSKEYLDSNLNIYPLIFKIKWEIKNYIKSNDKKKRSKKKDFSTSRIFTNLINNNNDNDNRYIGDGNNDKVANNCTHNDSNSNINNNKKTQIKIENNNKINKNNTRRRYLIPNNCDFKKIRSINNRNRRLLGIPRAFNYPYHLRYEKEKRMRMRKYHSSATSTLLSSKSSSTSLTNFNYMAQGKSMINQNRLSKDSTNIKTNINNSYDNINTGTVNNISNNNQNNKNMISNNKNNNNNPHPNNINKSKNFKNSINNILSTKRKLPSNLNKKSTMSIKNRDSYIYQYILEYEPYFPLENQLQYFLNLYPSNIDEFLNLTINCYDPYLILSSFFVKNRIGFVLIPRSPSIAMLKFRQYYYLSVMFRDDFMIDFTFKKTPSINPTLFLKFLLEKLKNETKSKIEIKRTTLSISIFALQSFLKLLYRFFGLSFMLRKVKIATRKRITENTVVFNWSTSYSVEMKLVNFSVLDLKLKRKNETFSLVEFNNIQQYYQKKVACEPYDADKLTSFIFLFTFPDFVLKDFIELISLSIKNDLAINGVLIELELVPFPHGIAIKHLTDKNAVIFSLKCQWLLKKNIKVKKECSLPITYFYSQNENRVEINLPLNRNIYERILIKKSSATMKKSSLIQFIENLFNLPEEEIETITNPELQQKILNN
ncbi:mediator complex subunit [Anaeramoeba flamelloides]|uniref:Mediator of RNA polymerase II transcription subunit 14 n=1 Tax=Anaeramoeba flamelloides TaxID=1746091 RepID=A0AAV7YUD0_9EUKA|nr:mediator complex subunit [Anaeramoeba flamelloides]